MLLLSLNNEIWSIIIEFPSIKELYSLKFSCKRFNTVVSLSKKIDYYRMILHSIVDVKKYYECFIRLFNDVLLYRLSEQFDKSTYIYLKLNLEPVKNLFLVFNVLLHLFTCPRSNYAKNDCNFCSRLYFDPLFYRMNVSNLEYTLILVNRFFVGETKELFKECSIEQFRVNICCKSLKHYNAINSDEKRCLLLRISQNPCIIIINFCETLVRIFYNFFYSVSRDFSTDAGKYRQMFLEECLKFVDMLFRGMAKLLNASKFKEIFLNYKPDIDYSTSFIWIVNKHYIAYCGEKFEHAN